MTGRGLGMLAHLNKTDAKYILLDVINWLDVKKHNLID